MSKEEPAWKAEVRKALDERFPFVRNMVTRDAIREFCESHILAAEQRGFQAGVNKTGDSVGKLREQLKTAKADALREVAEVIVANVTCACGVCRSRLDVAALIRSKADFV